ncbi:MAG: type I methionyl aminopeptidase [Peptococcaceae bacterium]|jgi:methionyl aminopeptidase|nr:type I methionyl aminopeptidase [Peptococcaceae bacterium]
MIICKSARELEMLYTAGQVVAGAIRAVSEAAAPGVTTGELERIATAFIRKRHGVPAFKDYNGFPGNICASVNEEVIHGIPSRLRQVKSGDIISIDVGAIVNGYVGDAAVTLPIGEIDADSARLLEVTREALTKGIEQAVIGNRLSDISHAIQTYVESKGFSVVRDYVGHGVGTTMHEEPQIPNYGKSGRGPRLRRGMSLAIEPMVNIGTYEVKVLADKWTVVTKDGARSAHFEHSIAITEQGPWILTQLDG